MTHDAAINYTQLTVANAAAIHRLEIASYPSDEAASLAQIETRLTQASAFFLGAFTAANDFVGFVNGTLASHRELKEETMSTHNPHGRYLCIHSVVVGAAHRRQGHAKRMVQRYVEGILDDQPQVLAIMLLAKPYLVAFYVSCGFRVTRQSPVAHGKDLWLELELDCVAARRLPIVQVDAFTSEKFAGNPAAIVRLSARQYDAPGVDTWMQTVAMENNLSETAFVAPSLNDPTTFHLRWFTPGKATRVNQVVHTDHETVSPLAFEVELCGHATLATAFSLFEDGTVAKTSSLHFSTRSGILTTRWTSNGMIEMNFPLCVPTPVADAAEMEALRDELVHVFQFNVGADVLALEKFGGKILCHVTPDAFAGLQSINFAQLAAMNCLGVIVTCQGNDTYDYINRFFNPRAGVNEDPVTGSAQCILAAYWGSKLKKTTLRAHQASHRPGDIELEVIRGKQRVLLRGYAAMVLRGTLD
ncbi:Aste57867_7173 [Aphanomyces stellatus]|uniref:Aste57867_7173 protein n=1 Tax=Aphanomyces stellatus TaxID=120398 RepID=A0A485KHL7_9STRA|nr:hypothetical protein As57867_007148 [Aphanomyces stellatus]VFT84101.1 Aste57867_7173 [Aphanomyces stellatus]